MRWCSGVEIAIAPLEVASSMDKHNEIFTRYLLTVSNCSFEDDFVGLDVPKENPNT